MERSGDRSLVQKYNDVLYRFLDRAHDLRFNGAVVRPFERLTGQIPSLMTLFEELAIQKVDREQARTNGSPRLYTEGGVLPYLTDIASGEKPLKGMSVGVVGGPEAVIFTELGAEAVSIVPWVSELPEITRPGLREVDNNLTDAVVHEYMGRFDITYTHSVMDPGSGVNPTGDWDCIPLEDIRYYTPYEDLLRQILTMTRPGGISLHNGGMLPIVVPKVKDMLSGAYFIEADGRRGGDSFCSMALLYRK